MATLRALRMAKTLEQQELAALVGVSSSTISYWENGQRRPRLPRLRRLAEVLGVKPADIDFPDSAKPDPDDGESDD